MNSGGLFIANGNLLNFTGATITGVTLDGSSDVPGFAGANVTFDPGNIAIDWAGLSGIAPGDEVVLDVTTASTLLEPASLLTTLLGLAGLGAWRLRRRSGV